jgi:hypothetical protein
MKPVSLKGSWVIKAPMSKIYEIVSDFENAKKYFPKVAQQLTITKREGNHLEIEAQSKTFGLKFNVKMKTELIPPKGFKSINESALAIEDEEFLMEEVPGGTKINYLNDVTIKNNFLKLFSKLIIGKPALKFWEKAYINELRKIVE